LFNDEGALSVLGAIMSGSTDPKAIRNLHSALERSLALPCDPEAILASINDMVTQLVGEPAPLGELIEADANDDEDCHDVLEKLHELYPILAESALAKFNSLVCNQLRLHAPRESSSDANLARMLLTAVEWAGCLLPAMQVDMHTIQQERLKLPDFVRKSLAFSVEHFAKISQDERQFLYELIQNIDDSPHTFMETESEIPSMSCALCLYDPGTGEQLDVPLLLVLSRQDGFTQKDLKSICTVSDGRNHAQLSAAPGTQHGERFVEFVERTDVVFMIFFCRSG
jgi:hypothetical protein